MTKNNKAEDKVAVDYLLKELTVLLNDTDREILVDMLLRLATLAAAAEQPETTDDFYAHIGSKLIAVFYAAHESITGARPSAAVLKELFDEQ